MKYVGREGFFFILFTLLFSVVGETQERIPGVFTYQGRAFQSDGVTPLTGTATFSVQVRSADGNCLLYQETHSGIDLTASVGFFALNIGDGTASSGLGLSDAFSNLAANKATLSGTCGGVYSPLNQDSRVLRVTVDVGGGPVALDDQYMYTVPQALVADTLNGFKYDQFVQSLTTTQRNALTSMVNGTTIYNITTGRFDRYNGATWGEAFGATNIGAGAQIYSSKLAGNDWLQLRSIVGASGVTATQNASDITLSIDSTYTQRRVTGSCTAGNFITAVAADGTVTCAAGGAGTVTSVTAGDTTITIGGTGAAPTVAVNEGNLDLDAIGGTLGYDQLTNCGADQILQQNGTGTGWTCAAQVTDTNTTYTAGSGLDLTGTTFSIPADGVVNTMIADGAIDSLAQLAAMGCTGNQVLQRNAGNTAWVCVDASSLDSNTTYSAGSGLDLTGTTFSIPTDGIVTTMITDDNVTAAKIADGAIDDLAQLASMGCTGDQIIKRNPGNTAWICASDDSNPNYWDAVAGGINYAGGNVGIGVTAPLALLDVKAAAGTLNGVRSSTTAVFSRLDNDASIEIRSGGNKKSSIYFGDSAGGAGGSALYYNDLGGLIELASNGGATPQFTFQMGGGKLGVGDTSPDAMIEASASAGANDLLMLSSDDNNDGNLLIVKNSGDVGIGTTTPDEKLHVVGSIKMVDGNQGVGKVLTSDANGVASWQAAGAGGETNTASNQGTGVGVYDAKVGSDLQFRNITAEAGNEISVTLSTKDIELDVVEANLDLDAIGGTLGYDQLANCAADQILMQNITGTAWTCVAATSIDTDTTYSAGSGLDLTGTTFSIPADGVVNTMIADGAIDSLAQLASMGCTGDQILKRNPGNTAWICAADSGGTSISGGTDNRLAMFNATGDNIENSLLEDDGTDINILTGRSLDVADSVIKFNNASFVHQTGSATSTFVGASTATSSSATDNTAVGYNIMNSVLFSGVSNTGVGSGALTSLTFGGTNTAVGKSAASAITTAGNTTAVGANALTSATGSGNTAIGSSSGTNATGGSSSNIFIGANAGPAVGGAITEKLYIDVTQTDTPLIYGNFTNGSEKVTINGNFDVTSTIANTTIKLESGDEPIFSFVQNASLAEVPQSYDIFANETEISIRDVTNGSKVPLRVLAGSGDDSLVVSSSGVSIGHSSPQAKLDVDGSVRLSDDATACSGANEGAQRYNSTAKEMQFCNGTVWGDLAPKGTLCGGVDDGGAGAYCKGTFDPSSSCPSNYTRTRIDTGSGDYFWSCVRN
ncbi:MAG: hypothetical protein KDD37_02630 [Bdellovibrionales bacterium]|nr:hypothetical protein [Bdellovibrionales bacterium]